VRLRHDTGGSGADAGRYSARIARDFAFEKFNDFQPAEWQAIKDSVKPNELPAEATIFGSDISGDMVAMTRSNLNKAGIRFDVPLKQIEAQEVKAPERNARHIADQSALRRTYRLTRRQHDRRRRHGEGIF
jgi:23S rRNA G2445 N2-methylase RlmL